MQVWPKNDTMRKILKHANGTKFHDEGPIDWPDDSFTARRVRDGDVLLEAPSVPEVSTRVDMKKS